MNKCINQIRTVLGDDADKPLYIETLPRRGYRFLAPVVSKTIAAPRPKVVESDSSEQSRAPVLVSGAAGAAASVAKEFEPDYEAALPDAEVAAVAASDIASAHKLSSRKLLVVSSLVAGALIALALVAGGFYWHSHRPLTHVSAKEWIVAGSQPQSYEVGTDSQEVFDGHPSACLRSKERDIAGFGTLMQTFGADKYRGERVRFRALAKSEGIEDWAGLWMRVDKSKEPGVAFDNMHDRPIKGTTAWRQYDVVLDVPQDAADIAFGVLLAGTGKVWLNGVEFEVVGSDVPTTGNGTPSQQLGDKPKLGFEK